MRFSDQVPISAPADRCQTYDGWVECAKPSKVVIDVGDGDDYVHFTYSVPGIAYEVYGGDGDDWFEAHSLDAENQPQLLDGGAGNDRIDGDEGEDLVRGGPGNDELDGGAGNDRVEGGYNNDTLTGGSGRDTIYGDSTTDTCNFLSCKIPFGNDVIDARDGEQDTIDCGFGEDRATVDAVDVVANCEQVEKGGDDGKLNAPKRYTRKQLRKGIAVAWDCVAACTVKVTLKADKQTARTLRTKLVASGKGSTRRAGTVKFRAKLTKKARKRIGRLRTGHATLAVAVKQGGATERHAQAVTLKR